MQSGEQILDFVGLDAEKMKQKMSVWHGRQRRWTQGGLISHHVVHARGSSLVDLTLSRVAGDAEDEVALRKLPTRLHLADSLNALKPVHHGWQGSGSSGQREEEIRLDWGRAGTHASRRRAGLRGT